MPNNVIALMYMRGASEDEINEYIENQKVEVHKKYRKSLLAACNTFIQDVWALIKYSSFTERTLFFEQNYQLYEDVYNLVWDTYTGDEDEPNHSMKDTFEKIKYTTQHPFEFQGD